MQGARGTAGYCQTGQHLNEVVDLGWRVVVGSAAARGDGRATVRAARAAIAPLVADGTFKTARAATVYVFGAYGWQQEIDAAVAVVRQAAVPYAEIFGWSLSEAGLEDEVQVYIVAYAFSDEMAALASGADS
jgi:cell division GTPase FtsZ